MKLIHSQRLETFGNRHPNAWPSLNAWKQAVQKNEFIHFAHLRQAFGSADYVRPFTVFNLAGNKYRLIALINYALGIISVEQVLTHAEYDKGNWKN